MYCTKCGMKMADGSNFCTKCGAKNTTIPKVLETNPSSILISVKCKSCNAVLTVNPKRNEAVCSFCGTPYIIQRPAKEESPVVPGVNIEKLLKRAEQFENKGDLERADAYYNAVLDEDPDNQEAQNGLFRIEKELDRIVILSGKATYGLTFGRLILRRRNLSFKTKRGMDHLLSLDNIDDISVIFNRLVIRYVVLDNKNSNRYDIFGNLKLKTKKYEYLCRDIDAGDWAAAIEEVKNI